MAPGQRVGGIPLLLNPQHSNSKTIWNKAMRNRFTSSTAESSQDDSDRSLALARLAGDGWAGAASR
jgi:hypothetical protein